ncbi:MAG: acetate kinase, partial [Gemmatimonadota bacterium]|nr:acetate kinase [Gemmatimonadota bacterium]
MKILVLNVGSSSLKFQLVETDSDRMTADTDVRLARGTLERIGGEAVYTLRAGEREAVRGSAALRDHRAAVEFVLEWMIGDASGVEIGSVAE